LDLLKDIQWCAEIKRLIGEVTFGQPADSEHKGRETDKHPSLVCTIECAATLGEVRAQTVEGHHKPRDMEGIADEDTLIVEGDNSGALTQNWDEGIIAHSHLKVGGGFERYEGSLIRKHVVSGPSIGHGKVFRQRNTNGRVGHLLD
jgi:hypothetical protein